MGHLESLSEEELMSIADMRLGTIQAQHALIEGIQGYAAYMSGLSRRFSAEELGKALKKSYYYLSWTTKLNYYFKNPLYYNLAEFAQLRKLIIKDPPFEIEQMDEEIYVRGNKECVALWTYSQKELNIGPVGTRSTEVQLSSYSTNRLRELASYILTRMQLVSSFPEEAAKIEGLKRESIEAHATFCICPRDSNDPFAMLSDIAGKRLEMILEPLDNGPVRGMLES